MSDEISDEREALSSLCPSIDESQCTEEDFQAFVTQLMNVQDLLEGYNNKIVDNTLCFDDITTMEDELNRLAVLEQLISSAKMRASYVTYKSLSLKILQESYRICNWLMQKQCNDLDDMFDINKYFNKIFESCAYKEDPWGHLNTLFQGVIENINYCIPTFSANLKIDKTEETATQITQAKKETKKSQKHQLAEQVVPDEVENGSGDNELQVTLLRVSQCLRKAVSKNNGDPISFHKFAIDPFSLTYSIENLFHLALLAKDRIIKIERDPDVEDDEFTTITFVQNPKKRVRNKDIISSLFTINHDLWKHYIKKYNITKRMIEQEDE